MVSTTTLEPSTTAVHHPKGANEPADIATDQQESADGRGDMSMPFLPTGLGGKITNPPQPTVP
jgi:hypothetical protein